jgi:hypothetical protein
VGTVKEKSPTKIANLHTMSRENETGLTDDKITAYQIFGWVPLAIFFIAAGTTALFGVLNTL